MNVKHLFGIIDSVSLISLLTQQLPHNRVHTRL